MIAPCQAARISLAALLLVITAYVMKTPFGRAPALGVFLEPAHGVWALAREERLRSSTIAGLTAPVRVVYDRRGVPHIFAQDLMDAYRALGYVTARDRLFQLFVQDLVARGKLTEIAGAAALDADREMRRLGLTRAADRTLAALDTSGESWRTLRSYADGINAYVDQFPAARLPLEFRLLGVRPRHWDAASSIHLFGRIGWTLAYIAPEVNRARAAALVGNAAAASLFPVNDPIQEPIRPNGLARPRFDFVKLAPPGTADTGARLIAGMLDSIMPLHLANADRNLDDESPWLASNNWAVSPRRSANGHALLAGDPHLELTLPPIWYEAHLVVPGKLDVYGVTIPGLPGIILGFNRDVAWTFTNTGADVVDLYRERVDDIGAPSHYLLDGVWKPVERRIETYRGRHGEVIATDTVYYTHRGPMRRAGRSWLSMRWTVLEPSDQTLCFGRAAQSRSVADLQAAIAQCYFAPAQNMLVADRSGSIAIRSTGHFPVRPGDGSGLTIRDGTTSASDWLGYLPPNDYPQAHNPSQGYLASANQQPVDPRTTSRYFGGSYDPWRALRINRLLRADSAVTIDDMRRFETDPGSERVNYFLPFFLAAARRQSGVRADTAKVHRAAKLLAQWDGRYTEANNRAVLFEAAMRELVDRTWDELLVHDRRIATPSLSVLAELLTDSASSWWDDRRTAEVEKRDDILRLSLAAALDETRRRYGEPDAGGWTWSRIRHQNLMHLLRIPALSRRDIAVQGGPETLNPSAGSGSHGASWRMVVDLGPELRAWGTYPGGQSGDPTSPRYDDHVALWTAGELEPLIVPHTESELGVSRGRQALTLRPRR